MFEQPRRKGQFRKKEPGDDLVNWAKLLLVLLVPFGIAYAMFGSAIEGFITAISTPVQVLIAIPLLPVVLLPGLWSMVVVILGISDPLGVQRGTEGINLDPASSNVLAFFVLAVLGYAVVYSCWKSGLRAWLGLFGISAAIALLYALTILVGPVARLGFIGLVIAIALIVAKRSRSGASSPSLVSTSGAGSLGLADGGPAPRHIGARASELGDTPVADHAD